MKLKLIHSEVSELLFSKETGDEDNLGKRIDLKYSVQYDAEGDKIFYVIFDIKVNNPDVFKLTLQYVSTFETSDSIDEEFKQSFFPYVNAPAIAFPFMRSAISFFLLNAGYEPVILPSINFAKAKNNQAGNMVSLQEDNAE